jgi:DNA polymerase III epsilon subunit-like protein
MHCHDLRLLRSTAHEHLLAVDRPLASQSLARLLFGPGHHEDPVAELVLRRLLRDDPRFLATPAGRWCAHDAPHLRRLLSETRYVVIDLETTGSVLGVDEVAEIGLAVYGDGAVRQRFSSLVRTSLPLPPWVRRLTGIRSRDLRAAPSFADLVPELLPLLEESVFVAHDLRFDLPFLRWEFTRNGAAMPDLLGLCTLRLAQQLWPELPSWRLSYLAEHFGHDHSRPHRAAEDADATATLLAQVLQEAARLGLRDLRDLLAVGSVPARADAAVGPELLAAEAAN